VPVEETRDRVTKYARAKSFLNAVTTLFDSFEDDALLRDKIAGSTLILRKYGGVHQKCWPR
jgi:hypothetical protein